MNYIEEEKIIELNLLALTFIRAKRADTPKVLSKSKIFLVLKKCREKEGDVFDKSTEILEGLIKAHAFESGNRRTAFLAMKYFLTINGAKTKISNDPNNSKVMLGIRKGYYKTEEIKEWIKNGKIREFTRKI